MDQCMFEVDLRSQGGRQRVDPRIGDIVTLVGAEGDAFVTIDEQADICGTIQHEIAIGYSQRMPRFWF
jgi:alanine racemase